MLLDGFVVGVEGGLEEEDGGDAAGHFLDVTDFFGGEGAAEKGLFAVGEPFFDDLIAADGVVPDFQRNVGPVGEFVEIDVAGGFAELGESYFFGEAQGSYAGFDGFEFGFGIGAFDQFASAGHGDAALAGMSPSCG